MHLFLVTILSFCLNTQSIDEKDIFIYEYHPKELGAYIIGFVELDSLYNVTENVYKISFFKSNGVQIEEFKNAFSNNLKHESNKHLTQRSKVQNQLVNFKCVKSEEYLNNKRFSNRIYNSIDESFLKGTNLKRRDILKKLIMNQ